MSAKSKEQRHPPGRKPVLVEVDGKQVSTRKLPKLTISMRPATRVRLDALAAVERKSPWKVIEDALDSHTAQLPAEDRKLVEALSRRACER